MTSSHENSVELCQKNPRPGDNFNCAQADESIAHKVRPRLILLEVQAIEFLLKIADPDRGSHSTKYDQAEKIKNLEF